MVAPDVRLSPAGGGRGLEWWHPLVSGDARTVVEAGISISGRVTPETEVAEEDLVDL
jgi:uncharacterized protein